MDVELFWDLGTLAEPLLFELIRHFGSSCSEFSPANLSLFLSSKPAKKTDSIDLDRNKLVNCC